jgi:hypothetical protein
MKRDWKRDQAKAAKHARLMARKPELREALYGGLDIKTARSPFDRKTRETAQKDDAHG